MTMILTLLFVLILFPAQKIGFVNSDLLISEYEGTKEAKIKFDNQKSEWLANVDSLKSDFQKSVGQYNKVYQSINESERRERERLLNAQEIQLKKYADSINEKIKNEDQKLISEILSQIDVFVDEYGERNDFDIILGSTSDGNILFGKEKYDITIEVLDQLNAKYRGE